MYTVYRYERDGNGPYGNCSLELSYYMRQKHKNIVSHPNIHNDFPDCDERLNMFSYKCGCPSKQLLINWFIGFNERLIQEAFHMYEIKVKQMVTGKSGYQVFFRDEDVISKTKIS